MGPRRIWVGVDPGRTGAMAMVYKPESSPLRAEAWPIPTDGKAYSLTEIAVWFSSWRDRIALVTVERQTPMPQSMGGGFANFGRGEARGWFWMLAGMCIPSLPVYSKTWQTAMHAGVSGETTKARSIAAARAIFPGVELLASEGARKPSDGMADAILLAEYGRRQQAELFSEVRV